VLTIGEFARASRLSPKALGLYDELGLLTPARVDPVSGYRLYEPGQLDRARLVAWLRRLGMPLARIRVVCDLAPAAAAAEVARSGPRPRPTWPAAVISPPSSPPTCPRREP
jgi:PPM family protein phosphatase